MRRLLTSITQASFPVDDIHLIISIDECNKSDEVQNVADNIEWTHGIKEVRRFKKRQGLRNHVIQCGDLSEKYGAVIILEDDLIVSQSFYIYAFQAVNFYKENNRIAGIGLYSHAWNGYAGYHFIPAASKYDTYLGQFSITWGECWTFNQWNGFKNWYLVHTNKLQTVDDNMPESISHWGNQSWGKYFAKYIVENDLYYVIPYFSLSTNFSEIGEHNNIQNTAHQVSILEGVKSDYFFPEVEDAIKYDLFFERIFEDGVFPEIDTKKVCVDLNGTKKPSIWGNYLLTTRKLPMELIRSYGLMMRPIDANIIHNVPGNDIFLYKCNKTIPDTICKNSKVSQNRMDYELYGFTTRFVVKQGCEHFAQAVKRRILKFIRR